VPQYLAEFEPHADRSAGGVRLNSAARRRRRAPIQMIAVDA